MSNLRILDGIRGLCLMIICYAHSFELTEYAIVSNVDEIEEYKKGLFFNLFIAGSYAFVEIFFFLSGFCQAISFLQASHKWQL